MTIMATNLLRIRRNKALLLSTLFVPVFLFVLIFIVGGGDGPVLRVGVVDHDQTRFTEIFTAALEENNSVVFLVEEKMREALLDNEIAYAVKIPAGFTQELINNKKPSLGGMHLKATDAAYTTIFFIENFMNAAENIARVAAGDQEQFYKGLATYADGNFTLEYENLAEYEQPKGWSIASVGLLAFGMLFFATSAAGLLVDDKKNKTLYRLLAAPLSIRKYMLQSIASFLLISLLQLTIVLAILKFAFSLDFGGAFGDLFLLLAIFSVVSVSFGVALAGFAKNHNQLSTVASLLITPMAMLSGVFWPREIMPEFMQAIGNFIPLSWLMHAVEKIILGEGIVAAYREVIVLLLFALVFFLVGAHKRVEKS